jgi:uncharacterized protein YjbI with pentapeptide repeats
VANPDHLALVLAGREAVDRWHAAHGQRAAGGAASEGVLEQVVGAPPQLLGRALLAAAGTPTLDLRSGRLRGARCIGVDFSHADLTDADLRGTQLLGCRFTGADLRRCRLDGASLAGSDLALSLLDDANLRYADLRDANLTRASARRVKIEGAILWRTVLGNTDLAGATGLDACHHLGASVLDVRTVTMSGALPVEFLRGCGLADRVIDSLTALARDPPRVVQCFISYAGADIGFVRQLQADLQDAGVRCWYEPAELKAAGRLLSRIDDAIRVHDRLLLVLSASSLQSPWVRREVQIALAKERRTGQQALFPIRLDDAVLETADAWPALVRDSRPIGDFRRSAEPDRYQAAFAGLLRALGASPPGP